MNTYPRINYRKIYEQHFGKIPKDSDGRTYEIHHIDGDHTNNSPENLKAVSIKEHYDIHFVQGDWGACLIMADRMKLSPEEKSKLAELDNRQRVATGRHNFIGGEIQRKSNQQRVANGTHHLLGPTHNMARIQNGTHNFVGGELQRKRVEDGTHHFLNGDIQSATNRKRMADGTHNFIGLNQKRMDAGTHNLLKTFECPHCGKTGKGAVMYRHHYDNCKHRHSSLG